MLPKSIATALVPVKTRMVRDVENQASRHLWKGFITTSKNTMVMAYVKQVKTDAELYREVLCALLARAIDVPSPEPLIVTVDAGHPDIPNNGSQLFFGTIDCESPAFGRFLHESQDNEDLLLQYDDLHKVICLDEFIANNDRHFGNILFNGQEFSFIDHGNALPPELKPHDPMNLKEDGTNQLADIMKEKQGYNEVKTKKFMNKVDSYIKSKISKTQIQLLPASCLIDPEKMNTDHQNIQHFLFNRLPILAQLVGFGVSSCDESGQIKLL